MENLKTIIKLTKSWFAFYHDYALAILNHVSNKILPNGAGCFPKIYISLLDIVCLAALGVQMVS